MTAAPPRLGVLGGSFDPPHIAHLAIASEAIHAMDLAHVLFVPAAAPPHKGIEEQTSAVMRLEMASLAVEDDLHLSASEIEIEHRLVYTVDTMHRLSQRYPDHALVFILGSDSLVQLDTWHEPERLLSLCDVAVAPRPGDAPAAIAATATHWGRDHITILDMPLLDISSSDIRARVAAGRPVRYLVPRRVEQYIADAGLYR